MPNINFKFDTDASKVEKAIQRLGSEFDKVVNSGDKIDQSLLDFAALVDKNAGKVQNLTNEMKKLSAINLQNMTNQFRIINEGGFDQLLNGLRNIQTSTVGVEGAVENLITKLGLSKNSMQQVILQMRNALGNMAVGSQEYRATLSQLNLMEQALSRLDQTVTANASTTISANNNKINSTQAYLNALSSVQQGNAMVQMQIGSTINSMYGYVQEYQNLMIRSYQEFTSLLAQGNDATNISSELLSANQMAILNEAHAAQQAKNAAIVNAVTEDQKKIAQAMYGWEDVIAKSSNPQNQSFADYMSLKIQSLVDDLAHGKIKYEEFVNAIKAISVNGLASIKQIQNEIKSGVQNIANVGGLNADNKNNLSAINNIFNKDNLDTAAGNMLKFATETKKSSDIVANTLKELANKSELEIQFILNHFQQLKQNSIVGSDQYKAVVTQIGVINQELNKTATANRNLAGGTSSATMAIQQMGFAVGDAGMITQNWKGALMGVGNNIPFVIQYIQEMSVAAKTAGTTGFKAFTQALAGPAGVLLAVNAVIFAMQVLPDVIDFVGKAAEGTAGKMKKLTKEIQETVYASQGEVATAVKQKAQFQALIPVIEKTTAKTKERKDVENELKKLLPQNIDLTDLYTLSQADLKKELQKINEELAKNVANTVKVAVANAIATEIAKMTVENMKLSQQLGEKGMNSAKWKTIGSATKSGMQGLPFGGAFTDIITAIAGGNDLQDAIKTLEANKKAMAELYKELEKVTATIDFSQKTFKDDRKDPKDKKEKSNEYTALEQLSKNWDKIIAKETDAEKIAFLKYQKAFAIWELSMKILKTQEEKDNAEIQYLEHEKAYALELLEIKEKYLEKITSATKEDTDAEKERRDAYSKQVEMRLEAIDKLKELQGRTTVEGMTEADRLEYDMKQELHAVEVDDFGLKEERMTEIKKYYAKKRVALERASWAKQMDIVANFLGAMSGLFKKNTLAYKALAIASATVDTYKAANMALASNIPPWNYIEMATVIATGLSNVASIVDTEVTGYAKGGLVNSPQIGLIGEAGPEIIAPVRDFASYSRELLGVAGGASQELSVRVKGEDLVFVLQKATKKVNRQKVGGTV